MMSDAPRPGTAGRGHSGRNRKGKWGL